MAVLLAQPEVLCLFHTAHQTPTRATAGNKRKYFLERGFKKTLTSQGDKSGGVLEKECL